MPEKKIKPVRLRAGRITLEDGAYLAGPNLYRERVRVRIRDVPLSFPAPLNLMDDTDEHAAYAELARIVDARCARLDHTRGPFGYEDLSWTQGEDGQKEVHVAIYRMRDRVDFVDSRGPLTPVFTLTLPDAMSPGTSPSETARAYARMRPFESDRTLAVAYVPCKKGVTLAFAPLQPREP